MPVFQVGRSPLDVHSSSDDGCWREPRDLGLCFGAQNGPRPDIEITCTSASELDPKCTVGQQRANGVANRNCLLEANCSEFQRNLPNLEYLEADCHGSLRSASMVAIMVHWVQPVRLLVGKAFARTVRVPRQGQSTTAQPVHALLGICFNFAVQQKLPTLQLHPCILTRLPSGQRAVRRESSSMGRATHRATLQAKPHNPVLSCFIVVVCRACKWLQSSAMTPGKPPSSAPRNPGSGLTGHVTIRTLRTGHKEVPPREGDLVQIVFTSTGCSLHRVPQVALENGGCMWNAQQFRIAAPGQLQIPCNKHECSSQ